MRIQPSTTVPLKLSHVIMGLRGLFRNGEIHLFEQHFAQYIGSKHAIAVGNGTTALYVTLLAMKELKPDRNEVILPAYTVPTLTLAFKKAGLTTVLCDIERDTFNMDPISMASVVTNKTLAIIPVHMFGFPCALEKVIQVGHDTGAYVLEDACQALGALLGAKRVGSIGEAGIFSLCKGKNISTFHGGLVTTDNDLLAEKIRAIVRSLPPRSFIYRISLPAVMIAYSLAMRPHVYGTLFPAISTFKSTAVHERFYPTVYNTFLASIGNVLLPSLEVWNAIRVKNGDRILAGLIDDEGIIVSKIIQGAVPVYNHVPVVFHDRMRLDEIQKKLFERGIDTGRMYERPIHHIYSQFSHSPGHEPFPHASYVAPRLLTLPTHPYLEEEDITTILKTFQEV